VNAAKERLTAMKRPVPQADPAAYARMKYELENRTRLGLLHRTIGMFEARPDVNLAAKTGAPAMQAVRPAVPVSVPAIAAGGQSGISDVSATVAANSEAIDKEPEARLGSPAAGTPAAGTPTAAGTGEGEQKAAISTTAAPAGTSPGAEAQTTTAAASAATLPTNHPPTKAQLKAYNKQQEKLAKQQKKAAKAGTDTTTTTTPAAATATPAGATTPAATPPAVTKPAVNQQ
jgi:hypothetical protein